MESDIPPDDDRNGFLEYDEFNAVADRIAHPNPYQLWQQLDSDRTGYVSLRDISEDDAQLWFEFRTFCGANFKSAKDMMVQILGINSEEERKEQKQISRSKLFGLRSSSKAHKSSTGAVRAGEECSFTITEEAWTSGLTRCGWQKHLPELFYALKDMRTGLVDATSLRWVEPEVRKYNQKQEMRRRTGAEQKAKAAARKSQRANLQNFKIFLRNRFGPTYHAWRKVLDTDGTMNLQRPELKKVCRQIVPPPRAFAPPASFAPAPSRAQKQDDRRWSEWQEASSRVYEDAQAAVRLTGTMYKDNKQFGFLMQDKTREEIFVLPLSCPYGVLPEPGTRVEFTLCTDKKTGKPRAEDVVLEGHGPQSKSAWWQPKDEQPQWRSQDFSDFSVTGEITKRTPKYGFIMSEECDDRILVIPSNCPGFGGELPPLGAVEGDHGNYGFIRCDQHPDHNHDKMFVLPWSCEGGEMFEIGTAVSFRIVEDRKTGRPRAEDSQLQVWGAEGKWPVALSCAKSMGGGLQKESANAHQKATLCMKAWDVKVSLASWHSQDVVTFSGSVPSASGAHGSRVPREPSHPPKARREPQGQPAPGPSGSITRELRRGQFARDNGTFGFIQPDGNGGDVFVLPSQFEGGVFPPVGTRLAFKVAPDAGRQQGERPKCTDVRILQATQVVSPPKPSSSPATPWQRARKWDAPEAQPPTPSQSKREACALMWRQFCDAEGEGVYDPEEHGAPFLRRFVKTLLHPENGQQPPSKKKSRGWKGDTTCLWLALDNGGNGTASLEELDPSCARQLARFRSFGEKRFGNRPAYGLWKAIDKQEKQRISHDLFVRRCLQMGAEFAEPELKELVYWLDWQEKPCARPPRIVKRRSVDRLRSASPSKTSSFWMVGGLRPTSSQSEIRFPDSEAAQEIRSLLLAKYGHFLKAWRTVLDKDNSNVCNWDEFYQAIKNLKYHGDIAGAWLALDEDLSGSITLSEIDSHSSEMLMKFKKWAVDQYGSVRTAFQVLDRDRSNELSLPEFRHAALVNGLSCCDDVRLFKCLDCGGHGRLLLSDVNFLDDWEANDAEDDDKLCAGMGIDEDLETKNSSNTQSRVWTEVPSDSMYGYATIAPGPGAYDHLASFGACSRMPTARHSGATSFRRRPESSWLKTSLQSVEPGGFAQDPKDSATQRRHKPAFRFSDRPRLPKEESYSPGPGTYSATSALSGPRFSMGCRRGFVLHPLQTPPFSARTCAASMKRADRTKRAVSLLHVPDHGNRNDPTLGRFGIPDMMVVIKGVQLWAHYDIMSHQSQALQAQLHSSNLDHIWGRTLVIRPGPSSPRSVKGVMAWLRAIYPPQGLPSPEHLQESFRILAFLACAASLRGEREKFVSEEAQDDEAAYKQFRQEFNRTADDSIAYMERLAHFRRFRAAVARHNARPDASWRAVVGPFADYTDAEFKALLGHRRTFRPEVKTSSSFLQTEPHKTIASTVDWTDKLSSVRSVKDWHPQREQGFVPCGASKFCEWQEQGSCGSCWAVAAIGALEMHAELALQKAGSALSSNQVKDCSTNPKHCGGSGGCQGSTSELAYDYIVKNGIALDSTYGGDAWLAKGRYVQDPESGRNSCMDKNRDSSCQPHKPYLRIAGFQPLPVNKLQPLMEAVSTKGPVVVSIDASGWNSYGGGIFDSCDKDAVVNHAVVLVGYGKSKSENKEYWLIRNSWGEGWGEKGFIRLLRHSGDQGAVGVGSSAIQLSMLCAMEKHVESLAREFRMEALLHQMKLGIAASFDLSEVAAHEQEAMRRGAFDSTIAPIVLEAMSEFAIDELKEMPGYNDLSVSVKLQVARQRVALLERILEHDRADLESRHGASAKQKVVRACVLAHPELFRACPEGLRVDRARWGDALGIVWKQ
eukprot:s2136_g3.t4